MTRRSASALLALAALTACNGWTHPAVGVTPRAGRLRVAVADGVGFPVAGAVVALGGALAGTTGADGTLAISGVVEGGYLVAVDAQGFEPETLATQVVFAATGDDQKVDVPLRAAVPSPPEIRLAFAGDVSFEGAIADPNRDGIQDDTLVPAGPPAAGVGAEALLRQVTPLFSRFDLVTASLATVLGDGATPHPRKSDRALAPPGVALGLARARVDAVVLGNDHAYDFLGAGVSQTLDALDLAGVLRVGAGRNLLEASAPLYLKRLGVTAAQVSLSGLLGHGTSVFSDSPPYFDASATRGGVAAANPLTVAEAVAGALGGTVDVVPSFVVAHLAAGPEWGVDPSALAPLADAAAAAGAVLAIGHGPRPVQGLSRSGGALVVGGLGQLVYGSNRPEGRSGMLLETHLRSGRLTAVRLWPLALVHDQPRVATGDLANRVIRRVAALSAPGVLVYPVAGRGEVALTNDATGFLDQPRRAVVPVVPGPADSATAVVPLLPGELESSVMSATVTIASGPDRPIALELGRELLWDGGFEEQAAGGPGLGSAAGWELKAPDGGVSDRSVRSGRLSMELVRKSGNLSDALGLGQGLVTLSAGRRYTFSGCWRVEGGGAATASLAIHGSRALHAPVIGRAAETTGPSEAWTCFSTDFAPLVETLVTPELRLAPPTSGTSRLFVDDLSLVEWDPLIPSGTVTLPLPNEYEFLRCRLPEGTGSVEIRWTARRFVPR
jgi:poly-gamma-glutamate capsule biosynthesis protein CapA/YwtB (metallophosphatase superfamily)